MHQNALHRRTGVHDLVRKNNGRFQTENAVQVFSILEIAFLPSAWLTME